MINAEADEQTAPASEPSPDAPPVEVPAEAPAEVSAPPTVDVVQEFRGAYEILINAWPGRGYTVNLQPRKDLELPEGAPHPAGYLGVQVNGRVVWEGPAI